MKTIKTDVLVIGSGIAGSLYAYILGKAGLKCTLISADKLTDCDSSLAQGGIIYEDKPDFKLLLKDIQRAGCGVCNEEAVLTACREGFKVIEKYFIKDFKTDFNKTPDGKFALTKEAAHSKRRILFSKDATGKAMIDAMQSALKKLKNVKIIENASAIDLLTLSHNSQNPQDLYKPLTCFGAYILDNKTKNVFAVVAKKTVLATGGLGQIFKYTTNVDTLYGSGIAMAYRIGARVINMEYTQFHPTVFALGDRNALISEAVRGEGAILINKYGKPFMQNYHKLKDLAPRDIVARAIEHERLKTKDDCVYLSLKSMKPEFIKNRFPNIYKTCLKSGVDITKQPIPVMPAMHYFCGGIFTDLEGRTNILNLNAVGECACTGFHGANRLASTSLLEAVAFAALCAQADIKEIKTKKFYLPAPKVWRMAEKEPDVNLILQDISVIKNTMWNYVGLIRSKDRLTRAEKILRHLKNEIDVFYKGCKLTPELLHLRDGAQTALLVTYGALKNKHSLGTHYRED